MKNLWTQQPETLCSEFWKNKNKKKKKKKTVASTLELLSIRLQVSIHFGHFSKLPQTFFLTKKKKKELCWSPSFPTGPNP